MCEYCVCGLWGGYSATEKSQSAKTYLNMNFPGGGGGGILQLKNHKVPRIPFHWGGGGYSATEKSQSTKIYLNMNFPGGGGG